MKAYFVELNSSHYHFVSAGVNENGTGAMLDTTFLGEQGAGLSSCSSVVLFKGRAS